jgi:hypothetical protein
MFDLSRITDLLSGLLENKSASEALLGDGLINMITDAGIDLGSLRGMGAEDIMSFLDGQGIDVSSFAPEQLQELLGTLTSDGDIATLAQSVLSRDEPQ